MKNIILLLLVVCKFSYSQNIDTSKSSISVKFEAGALVSGVTNYVMTADNYYSRVLFNSKDHVVLPNINVGIGIGSKHLIQLYNVFIDFSIEGNFGLSSTGKINTVFYAGKAEYIRTTIPIMIWSTLKTDGTINPFIKIGAGIENTKIKEKYYNAPKLSFDISDWGFCWGVGAGIDIKLNNRISLAFLVDSFIRENGIKKIFSDGRKLFMDFRIGNYSTSFELTYEL